MRVPEYQQSVQQQGLPDARQTTHYTADDFLGGTQKAAMGYGVELAGNLANDAQKVAVRHYEDQLKQARDARVLDANTKMMTHVQDAMYGPNGALNKTGEAAFLGSDGKTVSDIAFDGIVKQQQAIADTLSNDEQKDMFNAHSSNQLMSMRLQLMGHEAEQHRVYVKSTLEANNAAQVSNIGLNYNDNDGITKSIEQIKANSAQLALTNGQGAEAGAVIAQTHISGALNKVINSALDKSDFATAHNVLKNFAPNMNTDDLTTAYSKIAKGKGEATALSTAFSTVESMKRQTMPNDGDRSFNILLGAESPTGQYSKDTKFYGLRHDGTAKGSGYFGELKRPDGDISTELTIGVNINGKEMEIPTLVPTLSEKQKDWLLTHPANEKLPDDIEKVAVAHAKQRLKDGLSVFHDTPEPVTSGKGAVGAAQVMRDTGPEAAALAGLPWDENKWKYDPAYNTAIGKAYFQKQLQNNNGDLGKAYAAYNAGPGALKAAVDKGGDNWLAMLPSETQAYVTNNLSAFNAGEGKPTQPTKQDVVYAAINALPKNSSPEVIKQTMANTEHLVELQTQATKQNEESVVAQMYTELSKNGGDLNAIPQSLRDQIPGEKLNAIQNFAESQGKGREHSDLAVYNHLVENPNYLLRLTPDQFVAYRNDLSESDWHSLQKQRESLRNPAGADSPDNLDTQAVNSVTNNLLSQLNIDATPKDTDEAGKARLGTIRKYINDSLLSQQAQTGKKFKEAEINKYITGLFAKDVQFKKSFLGFNYGTENKQLLLTKADEIPSDTRDSIKAAFKKNGVDDPTDGQILGSYFNGMSK
jgi:hypothetical protein